MSTRPAATNPTNKLLDFKFVIFVGCDWLRLSSSPGSLCHEGLTTINVVPAGCSELPKIFGLECLLVGSASWGLGYSTLVAYKTLKIPLCLAKSLENR